MDPGKRDALITFERGVVTVDNYGGETPNWDEVIQAWARVKYGTGQERREAAQERMSQAATFECEWSETLASIGLTDRINFGGDAWDIISKAPLGHREIHFAAVRSA
jgi:SPP1 family predicted phage head-tail adaptor